MAANPESTDIPLLRVERAMQNPLKKLNPGACWRKPLFRWIFAAVVLLFVACGVIGYFVIPGVVESKAQQFVSEKFRRNLHFGKISFNPLTLTVDFDNMRLTEPEQEDDFVTFDRLTIDLSGQSLFRMAPVIEEIKLTNPRIHLVRSGSNRYNFDDFIAFAMEPREDDSPARFSINNIQIENAVIEFDDLPQKKRHRVDELNISIPFVSSIPSQVDIFVDLAVSGRFNREKIELAGKARPFYKDKDGTVNVKLDKISLPAYMDYLPFQPNFALKDGKLSLDLEVGFGQPEDNKSALTIDGNLTLTSLWLTEKDGKTLLKMPEIGVDIARSDILSGNIGLNHIWLKQPEFYLERNKAGQWNVERLARIDMKKTPEKASYDNVKTGKVAKESLPLSIALKQLTLEEGQLRIYDQVQVVPADFSVRNFGLNVEDVILDISGRNASVEKLVSTGTQVQFVHGKLKFLQDKKRMRKPIQKTASEMGDRTGFGFHVNRLKLNDWAVHFENRDGGKPVVTRIDGLNVAVDHLSDHPTQPVQLSVNAGVNRRGTIAVNGSLNLSPFTTDLDLNLKDVDVRFIQPYIEDFVNLSIRQADLTVQGKLRLSETKRQAIQGRFAGDAGISRLVTVDQLSRQPFVSWKALSFKGIRADLAPLSIIVDQVGLNGLSARMILSSAGRLNLQDVLRSETGEKKSLTESEEKPEKAGTNTDSGTADTVVADVVPSKKKERPAYSIRIKKWRLNNGNVRFSDNFIRPRYTANLVNLKGSLSGLTTDPEKRAAVDIRGRVNGAPLVIAGSINPLSESLSLDIAANVKGMELAQFSAYSGKYIGYGIEKGKLSFDVAYKVENGQLSAENALVLDQLTLGDKVESESAVNLPVQLALALLKDRNGVIDINLPVSGSLNDPEFSVGGIIFRVFVNLIQKAVTAPFSLLASLVGDTEELSWLTFEPGSYVIAESEQKKLESLAKALGNRPALTLEIAGKYDPAIDSDGLGKQIILRKIRAMKAGELGKKADGQKVTVNDREYHGLLKRLYSDEDFKKPRNWIGFSKSLPVSEMERLLSRHFAGKKDDLILLANRRAQTVKEWLVSKGGIPEERLFVLASKARDADGDESGNRVDFSLK